MKKKIFGLAIIALSLTSFTGMAQEPAGNENPVCNENACGKKPDGQHCRETRVSPFEGLDLTDAQKAQLEQLGKARQQARVEKAKAARIELKDRAEAMKAERKQYLEEVKAIIGPDQYVAFLENMVISGGNHGHKAFHAGDRGPRKGMCGKHGGKRCHGNHHGNAPQNADANADK